MKTEFLKGFPSYDDYKSDPKPSNEIYRQFVFDYFEMYGITMPEDLGVQYCHSDDVLKTSRYQCETGRQTADGTWYKSGIWNCGDAYFVGDDKRGYLISTAVMRAWSDMDGLANKEKDGVKYLELARMMLMQNAVMMTGFRILMIPDDARVLQGAGPTMREQNKDAQGNVIK